MAQYLYLLRHAYTDFHGHGRFVGRADHPLNEKGRRQAAALAPAIRAIRPDGVVASPARRVQQTLALAAPDLAPQATILPELWEIDFGTWEGRSFAEIAEAEPEAARQWAEFAPDFRFPGGDAIGEFFERVGGLTGRLADWPAERLLVACHGGVIRVLLCRYLNLPDRSYVVYGIGAASLTVIRLHGAAGVLETLAWTPSLDPEARHG